MLEIYQVSNFFLPLTNRQYQCGASRNKNLVGTINRGNVKQKIKPTKTHTKDDSRMSVVMLIPNLKNMNKFIFLNLTEDVRQFMLNEMNSDIQSDKLYKSTRLNSAGLNSYPNFLRRAILNGDAESFQSDLENGIFFNPTYLRMGKDIKMPSNAAQLLSQNEFNRYYIRGVCLKAIDNHINQVEIYRGRQSSQSRPESDKKIGTKLDAALLLDDLRNTIGAEPTILPEINSGLTVKI